MTKEHQELEAVAVRLDEQADDLFADIANGEIWSASEKRSETIRAQALRRAAEIIRHQIECEA